MKAPVPQPVLYQKNRRDLGGSKTLKKMRGITCEQLLNILEQLGKLEAKLITEIYTNPTSIDTLSVPAHDTS